MSNSYMIAKYGRDPQGRECNDCEQLIEAPGKTRMYYKCLVRGVTHGKGTDHGKHRPACRLIGGLDP